MPLAVNKAVFLSQCIKTRYARFSKQREARCRFYSSREKPGSRAITGRSRTTLEFDSKLLLLGEGEKPKLEGNVIIEDEKLIGVYKRFLPIVNDQRAKVL